MSLILYTSEQMEKSLSHGAILCTREQMDGYYLMHYRTKGSKNGVRNYQNEDGSLTPEGYRHYAEMYGWNKRLAKIDKAERRAERLEDKAAKADLRVERAKMKLGAAERNANAIARARIINPNKHRNNAIDESITRVATKENMNYQSKQNKADSLHTKAKHANLKAEKLIAKMQRKEEKMQKYINEDGSLNEEAMKKYTYNNGEGQKMNLLGRLKFGNEYSNKFEKDSVDKIQRAEQERVESNLRTIDKRMKEYDDASTDPQHKRAALDQLAGFVDNMKDGTLPVDKDRMQSIEKFVNDKISEEKKQTREMVEQLDKYDSMPDKAKAKFGNDLLESLAAENRRYNSDDDDFEQMREDSARWLRNQVYEKAGSINAGDYKPGTNAAKANEAAEATLRKLSDREDQIKREIGYKSYDGPLGRNDSARIRAAQKEEARLEAALKKDSVWRQINNDYSHKQNDVIGAILKDLGFSDTSRNRSILWRWGWLD